MKKLITLSVIISGSLMAGTIDLGDTTTGTVSFNGNPGTLTLGSNGCGPLGTGPACTFTGTASNSGLNLIWTFVTPNPTTITYFYGGSPATLQDSNNPAGTFSLADTNGDVVSGTFNMGMLESDGGTGYDITGTLLLNNSSYTGNSASTTFTSLLGVGSIPPNATGSFILDVGNCTAGSNDRRVGCIPQVSDPTAQVLDLTITASASTPEPATFVLLGLGLCAFSAKRWMTRG